MNFLAHTLLSCQNEDMLIGNFMADFLTKNEAEAVKPSLRQGIEVHKRIDSFTDSHPSVLEAIKILRPTQKKYSPVVVDILLDYILTQKWSQYCVCISFWLSILTIIHPSCKKKYQE